MLTFVLKGCDNTVIVNNEKNDDSFVITGSIEDWIYQDSMVLILGAYVDNEFYDFKSAPISSNGTFNLSFPNLAEPDLIPLVELEGILGDSSLSICNPTTKGILVSLYIANKENNNQKEILNHRLDLSGDSIKVYKIDFVFCDDRIDVIGEINENNIPMVYNLHFNNGWNKRVVNKSEITSIEIVGYKWLMGN